MSVPFRRLSVLSVLTAVCASTPGCVLAIGNSATPEFGSHGKKYAVSASFGRAQEHVKHVSGLIRAEDWRVGPDELVWVDDDLRIEASGEIAIEGQLLAVDREADALRSDGVHIELVAGKQISISGQIRGGRGADRLGADGQGGNGSDIVLRAPLVRNTGLVSGGDGGRSGSLQAKGSRGGNVELRGTAAGTPGGTLPTGYFGGVGESLHGGPGGVFGYTPDGAAK